MKACARAELSQFEVTPTQFVCEEDEVEGIVQLEAKEEQVA